MSDVYLIHLEQPLSRGIAPTGKPLYASHYIGCADDLDARIKQHAETLWEPYDQPSFAEGKRRLGEKHGPGSTFLALANFKGITWQVARVWKNAGFDFEKRVKGLKCAPRLCPICNPNAMKLMECVQ